MKPSTISAYREAFGGRRFLLTVGVGIVDTLLLIWNRIDQLTYSNLTLWTVAAYITAGTAQKVQHAFSNRKSEDTARDRVGDNSGGDVRSPQ